MCLGTFLWVQAKQIDALHGQGFAVVGAFLQDLQCLLSQYGRVYVMGEIDLGTLCKYGMQPTHAEHGTRDALIVASKASAKLFNAFFGQDRT